MTNHNKSIPKTISLLVVGLAFSLTLIYSLFVMVYAWVIEDNIFNRMVAAEAQYIIETHTNSKQIPSPRSGFMKLHSNWEGVPAFIVEAYKLDPERVEYTNNDVTTHIHVLQLDGTEHVLVANMEGFEVSRDYFPDLLRWLAIFAVVSCVIVSVIVFSIAKKTLSPLKKLSEQVKSANQENLPSNFSNQFPDNEVGTLAKTIETSFKQLQEALKREVNFTRDVSHEIRTPISVLKNSLKNKLDDNTLPKEEYQKINQVSFELEQITNTLLALARNESKQVTPINLTEKMENTILNHFELNNTAKGKALNLELNFQEQVVKSANENLVQILLNNIFANIVQYSSNNNVTVELTHEFLLFENETTTEVPEQPNRSGVKGKDSSGIGQGLNLIDRICQANDWQMQTSFAPPKFKLVIYF